MMILHFRITDVNIAVLLVVLLLILWAYRCYNLNFDYWKSRGVPYATPLPFFGNVVDLVLMRKCFSHILNGLYRKFSGHRYFGIFRFMTPCLVIRDPVLVKDILVDHFDCFQNRGFNDLANCDPVFKTVYTVEGAAWETLRKELCSVFRKEDNLCMFHITVKCAKRMCDSLQRYHLTDIEAREMFLRFTTDVSGLYFVGLELNSVEDFTSNARKVLYFMCETSWRAKLSQTCLLFLPKLWKFIKIFDENRAEEFLVGFVNAVMRYRKDNFVIRNDLVQLFMGLKNSNINCKYATMNGGMNNKLYETAKNQIEISNTMIAAHVVDFIVAGSEIISLHLSYCMHELALHPDIQNKLKNELDTVIRQNGGNFTYDIIHRLKYMDQVLNETIRKYDVFHIERICSKPYSLPGSNMMLEKGDRIVIPLQSFHNDPNYFPKPEVFDPERFNPINNSSRHPFTFIPFGDGPRNCICVEYCNIKLKVGVAMMVLNYKVKLCKKSIVPLPVESMTFFNFPSKGVWLQFEKRQ